MSQLAIDFSAPPLAPQRRWTVYVMSDERPGGFTYVGCTVSRLAVRLGQHKHDPCAANSVRIWMELLRREGVEPSIDTLYVADDEQTGLALERSTISSFAEAGVKLLNTQHTRGRRGGTVGHIRFWSLCQSDYAVFRKRRWSKRVAGHARAIWCGYTPKLSAALELEETPGIPLRDWICPA